MRWINPAYIALVDLFLPVRFLLNDEEFLKRPVAANRLLKRTVDVDQDHRTRKHVKKMKPGCNGYPRHFRKISFNLLPLEKQR